MRAVTTTRAVKQHRAGTVPHLVKRRELGVIEHRLIVVLVPAAGDVDHALALTDIAGPEVTVRASVVLLGRVTARTARAADHLKQLAGADLLWLSYRRSHPVLS